MRNEEKDMVIHTEPKVGGPIMTVCVKREEKNTLTVPSYLCLHPLLILKRAFGKQIHNKQI